MIIKRAVNRILLTSLFFISLNIVHAANDTTSINLELTHTVFVNLVGTVVGAEKFFSVDDIKPAGRRGPGPTVSLGTLGVESNISGSCTLDFSTRNNFRLRHTVSNRRLTNYRLNYKGSRINRRNTTMVLPSCNEVQSSLDFTATGRFRRNVSSGIYQDVVTITVTTQ